MHHQYFTLQSHADVTKFEFEDGVIRHAAAHLLAEVSTIQHFLIDLPTERAFTLGEDIVFPNWDGSLVVSSSEPDTIDADRLAELLIDVASIVDHHPVILIEHSDLENTWVGTATPASKLSFVARMDSGIDSARFAAWLRDVLSGAAEKFPGMGCRAIGPLDDSNGENDATLSFWFPDDATLNSALSDRFFDPIVTADVVESGSVRAWSTVEHRKAPNPNAWEMPTGRIMPVEDVDTDS